VNVGDTRLPDVQIIEARVFEDDGGLHYQVPPKVQIKSAQVIQGKVIDVAVNSRFASPTPGQWVGEIVSAENKK